MAKLHLGLEIGSWVNLIAGAALVTLVMMDYYDVWSIGAGSAFTWWSTMLLGLVLIGVAGYDAWGAATERAGSLEASEYVLFVIGAWLVAYPWYSPANDRFVFVASAIGLVVAAVTAYGVWAAHNARVQTRGPSA